MWAENAFFEDEKIYCLIVMVRSCCAAISIFPGTAKMYSTLMIQQCRNEPLYNTVGSAYDG